MTKMASKSFNIVQLLALSLIFFVISTDASLPRTYQSSRAKSQSSTGAPSPSPSIAQPPNAAAAPAPSPSTTAQSPADAADAPFASIAEPPMADGSPSPSPSIAEPPAADEFPSPLPSQSPLSSIAEPPMADGSPSPSPSSSYQSPSQSPSPSSSLAEELSVDELAFLDEDYAPPADMAPSPADISSSPSSSPSPAPSPSIANSPASDADAPEADMDESSRRQLISKEMKQEITNYLVGELDAATEKIKKFSEETIEKRLAKSSKKIDKQCTKVCRDSYASALGAIKEANMQLQQSEVWSTKLAIRKVAQKIGTCSDCYAGYQQESLIKEILKFNTMLEVSTHAWAEELISF